MCSAANPIPIPISWDSARLAITSRGRASSLRMLRSACVPVQPPTSLQWASIAVRCPIRLSLTMVRTLFFSA